MVALVTLYGTINKSSVGLFQDVNKWDLQGKVKTELCTSTEYSEHDKLNVFSACVICRDLLQTNFMSIMTYSATRMRFLVT